VYSIYYLAVVKRNWERLIEEKEKQERKRISKIWKRTLLEHKNSGECPPIDFNCEETSDGGGLGAQKQIIKLPRHYEPSPIMRLF
jgi:hypothetical protein